MPRVNAGTVRLPEARVDDRLSERSDLDDEPRSAASGIKPL